MEQLDVVPLVEARRTQRQPVGARRCRRGSPCSGWGGRRGGGPPRQSRTMRPVKPCWRSASTAAAPAAPPPTTANVRSSRASRPAIGMVRWRGASSGRVDVDVAAVDAHGEGAEPRQRRRLEQVAGAGVEACPGATGTPGARRAAGPWPAGRRSGGSAPRRRARTPSQRSSRTFLPPTSTSRSSPSRSSSARATLCSMETPSLRSVRAAAATRRWPRRDPRWRGRRAGRA